MLPRIEDLKVTLLGVIADRAARGYEVAGLRERVQAVTSSYDELAALHRELDAAPRRADWPYVEPDDLETIWAECPYLPQDALQPVDLDAAGRRAEAGFLGSVCGCVLGKPVEVRTTMAALQRAAEAAGEWPLRDYLSEGMLDALGDRHRSWREAVRGRIRFVARDDDINYTVLGMLILEQHGVGFGRGDVMQAWLANLPLGYTFGPERMLLTRTSAVGIAERLRRGRGLAGIGDDPEPVLAELVTSWNPGDELCGAQIRADAYGYACPGRPRLAAELAWRDAGWTHRGTGLYAAMFTAAAIAGAYVIDDPLELCRLALRCVPQRSRFRERVSDCLEQVAQAADWRDGYRRVHDRYGCYGHCQVYQETGTLINTLRFAAGVEDGICLQVSQGNDTDSYGATAGSLLGVLHGRAPEARWLAPFNDEIRTTVAGLYESSLTKVAQRMGRLPHLVASQLGAATA